MIATFQVIFQEEEDEQDEDEDEEEDIQLCA